MTSSLRRRGTTVVELTVVIVLLGLILGGLLSVIDRQRRFYRETSFGSARRSQVRQAASILPAELRALGPGDIIQALDSAIEFHSTIASGVVCESGPDWIALAPMRRAGARTFRGELTRPAAGDVAHVLAANMDDPASDLWPALTIAGASNDADACPAGPFIDREDAGQPRLRLELRAPPAFAIQAGTPVRVTRPVRYSLYRSGDRLWYLGADEWTEGRWSGIQPVSGPYAAYGRAGSGIRFSYLDASGAVLESPVEGRAVARIRLVVRALAGSSGRSDGRGAPPTDSAVVEVALRNRSRS